MPAITTTLWIVTTLADIDGNVFVRDRDGNENNNNDYVLKGGDIVTILNGEGEGVFVADLGGNAYVLKDGETELPSEVKEIWRRAILLLSARLSGHSDCHCRTSQRHFRTGVWRRTESTDLQ